MNDDYDPTPPIADGKDYHNLYHRNRNVADCPYCDHIYGEWLDEQRREHEAEQNQVE